MRHQNRIRELKNSFVSCVMHIWIAIRLVIVTWSYLNKIKWHQNSNNEKKSNREEKREKKIKIGN